MKEILSVLAVFFAIHVSAQYPDYDFEQLVAKEQKGSAAKMTAGNTNPNTLNYDLRYQRMDLTLDPAVNNVAGSVTSHFIPNQAMSSIYFDLTPQLTVSQVTFHGNSLNFQQIAATNELKIDFTSALSANDLDSLTIHYSGVPATNNNAFGTDYQNGVPVLATLSEPYGAQDWFPTKQSLNDKIEKFDFKINTPSQYSVAANGILMSETMLPNNRKLTFWRTNYPMTAYLAALSITNFTKINDVIGNPPFPFVNYLYPATVSNATSMANIEWTKQCMATFETYFGPYPFRSEKYGHMEFQYGGGMEHQTMSSMGGWGKGLIAHELAHQWFGDKVTCGTWNDIWLNEGFATFGEHLVYEKLLMTPAEFLNYLSGQKNFINSAIGGSTYVSDANLTSVNAIFNGRLSYAKGGYIVRMIKWILTDPIFYQAIKDYQQRPNLAYNYAVTSDLNSSLLQSTGKDFTGFFADWVYGQGYPTYTIKWKQTANQTITFSVDQTQSHASVSYFEMPLPIKVNGTAGQVLYLKPENTHNNQYFTFPVGFDIASVEFNYEHQILDKNSTVQMDPNLSLTENELTEIALYPVPAVNEVNLKGIKRSEPYRIYSMDGKLVKSGNYVPNKAIRITELVPGTYIFNIENRNFKFTKK